MLSHFLITEGMQKEFILSLLKFAADIKKDPHRYRKKLEQKTLLMLFEQPSLRTRLSFETAMTQLGGHAIYYSLGESTLGKKESMKEFARTASRYADGITARLNDHYQLLELAEHSDVPVINAMTNYEHPCQVMGDLLTIQEKFRSLSGLKLAYLGDCNNNVTNSLMFACSALGMNVTVAGPKGKEFMPSEKVMIAAKKYAEGFVEVTNDPVYAVKEAHVVYTDSWMSYRIPKGKEPARAKALRPYQVNSNLMQHAYPNAVFMHCLPAKRGAEVTDDVIDDPRSVIFDQAENRLHAQKAILLTLLEK